MQFPDAVLVVVDYLRSVVPPGTLVYSRVPETRPAEFIRVERLGGLRNTLVTDRPRIDVECWSGTEEDAEALMSKTRAFVSGPQWLPDSVSGQPRYSFAVEFSVRGTEMS